MDEISPPQQPLSAPPSNASEHIKKPHTTRIFLFAAGALILGAFVYVHTTQPFQKTVIAQCSVSKTATDLADEKHLEELQKKIQSLSDVYLEAPPEQMDEMLQELTMTEKEYVDTALRMARREISRVSEDELLKLYGSYCAEIRPLADLSPRQYAELHDSFNDTGLSNAMCRIQNGDYKSSEVRHVLTHIGLQLANAGKFDLAMSFYHCAASHYDTVAMYRIAQVFAYGSDAIKDSDPNIVVLTPIVPDLKNAYFWIAALIHTEQQQKFGVLDSGTTTGWDIISLLDSLQQNNDLSDKDLLDLEMEAGQFVAARYPVAEIDPTGVYKHSMRAIMPAMEAAQSE